MCPVPSHARAAYVAAYVAATVTTVPDWVQRLLCCATSLDAMTCNDDWVGVLDASTTTTCDNGGFKYKCCRPSTPLPPPSPPLSPPNYVAVNDTARRAPVR